MDQHRVITQDRFGGPEVLRSASAPIPAPLPTEIRVRVFAAGVNPADAKTRAGAGVAKVLGPPPFVLGWDVAGTVDAVGRGVTRFAVGDRVLGMPWFPRQAGAYAEYVTAPSRQFAGLPDTVGDIEAGALPLAGLTAWQALVETAAVAAGQRVLVRAGGGGVGHLAVQIAKARGAYVIATAARAKHAMLTDLGADEVYDHHEVEISEVVGDLDVALELFGGESVARVVAAMRPGGIIVALAGDPPVEQASRAGVRAVKMLAEPDGAALGELAALAAAGHLRVEVSETFELEDAATAHRAIEGGHTRGKIVLVQPG